MSVNLFEESRRQDLERAVAEYRDAKQNYQRMVRLALQEKDATRREEQIKAIEAENGRLVRVVEGLVAMYREGGGEEGGTETILDTLDDELAQFRQDLETLQSKQDTITQLHSVLTTLSNENEGTRTTYYGYIVAVLVMLVIVFVLFVYSYISTAVSAVSTVASAIPEVFSETPSTIV
jgi:chromosome segregation ATPase